MALLVSATIATPTTLIPRNGSTVVVTAAEVLAIAPSSGCCKNSAAPLECATAKKAVAAINKSYVTYNISSKAEAAALIGLQAAESDNFRYFNNHSPGRPGQGTRNMQMIGFNLLYAKSIPALKNQLKTIIGSTTSAASLSDDQKNKVRDLVNSRDEYSFGSAPWFLTSQCTPDQRTALQKGDQAGWVAFIQSCVKTDPTDATRLAKWKLAQTAFKLSWR